jgi:hypothetical protein
MAFATAVTIALALAAPTGLPVLHSTSAEDYQQRQMMDRLRDADTPGAALRREAPARDAGSGPDSGHDAAWRADHLTCRSHKGRTAQQYQRECAAWAAEQAAAEAAPR